MKKIAVIGLVSALAILLGIGSPVYAESSGNFSAKINTTQCLIDNGDGTFTDNPGIGDTFLETIIKTPNSQFTALVIRPSLVTGLYTKTKVDQTTTTATAWAGVKVRVLIDGKVVAPGTPVGCDVTIEDGTANCPGTSILGKDAGWVYYDKRWQQVTANFLTQIAACTITDPDDPLFNPNCNLELILSTLSAHSMDYVVGDVGGGTHTLRVEWMFDDSDDASGNSAACVGPGVLTVQQVKTFQTGSGIEIQP